MNRAHGHRPPDPLSDAEDLRVLPLRLPPPVFLSLRLLGRGFERTRKRLDSEGTKKAVRRQGTCALFLEIRCPLNTKSVVTT